MTSLAASEKGEADGGVWGGLGGERRRRRRGRRGSRRGKRGCSASAFASSSSSAPRRRHSQALDEPSHPPVRRQQLPLRGGQPRGGVRGGAEPGRRLVWRRRSRRVLRRVRRLQAAPRGSPGRPEGLALGQDGLRGVLVAATVALLPTTSRCCRGGGGGGGRRSGGVDGDRRWWWCRPCCCGDGIPERIAASPPLPPPPEFAAAGIAAGSTRRSSRGERGGASGEREARREHWLSLSLFLCPIFFFRLAFFFSSRFASFAAAALPTHTSKQRKNFVLDSPRNSMGTSPLTSALWRSRRLLRRSIAPGPEHSAGLRGARVAVRRRGQRFSVISSCLSLLLSCSSALPSRRLASPVPIFARQLHPVLAECHYVDPGDAGERWRRRWRAAPRAICVAAAAAACSGDCRLSPSLSQLTFPPYSYTTTTTNLQVSLATRCTSAAPRALAPRSSGRSASE